MPRRSTTSAVALGLLLALAACADDGPPVAVVPSGTAPPAPEAPVADATARDAASVVGDADPVAVVERSAPRVDDRPELVSGAAARFRPDTVAVIGDSLALSAAAEITDGLESAGLDVVALDAVESRRIANGGSSLPPGVDAITQILEGDRLPELWVIALGTNDVGAQVSVDTFRADITELIGLLPDDAPIVWVDLWIRDRSDAIVVANEQIRSVLRGRYGISIVVDWYSQGLDPATITGDGVHLTSVGKERFAAAIVEAVDAFFPAG